MDQYNQRKWLTDQQHQRVVRTFAGECLRLMMIEALDIVPVNTSILSECWNLIEKYHVYQGDALQIVSCRKLQSDFLLSADKELLDIAEREGLHVTNVEEFESVKKELSAS